MLIILLGAAVIIGAVLLVFIWKYAPMVAQLTEDQNDDSL